MLIDLHVHSRATAGCALDPAQVVAKAAALGLDGVAFTDLNTLSGARECLAAATAQVKVFVGVELVTDHGHFLAFFADPEKVSEPAQLFGETKGKPWGTREVLDKVAALGGVAIAAHPYDRDVDFPSGDYIFTLKDRLAALEGLNARKRGGVNDLAVEASEHMGLACVGGSGAMAGLDEVGKAATWFKDGVDSHEALLGALRSGQFFPVGAGRPPPLSEMARAPKHHPGERSERDFRDRGDRDRDRRGPRGRGRGGRGGRGGGRDRR